MLCLRLNYQCTKNIVYILENTVVYILKFWQERVTDANENACRI